MLALGINMDGMTERRQPKNNIMNAVSDTQHMGAHLEILTKLPTTTLLLPPRCTVVGEICVGIVVKESWHDEAMK